MMTNEKNATVVLLRCSEYFAAMTLQTVSNPDFSQRTFSLRQI